MKNFFFIGISILLIASCKEEPPYINYEESHVTYETTYVQLPVPLPDLREVLIEDISGVSCVNCPDAAVRIKAIKATNPGRVNSITIYPNDTILWPLVRPVNRPDEGYVSKQDLRTDAGKDIINALNKPGALPNGYVDRKFYAGSQYRYIDRTVWADKVNLEKDSVTPVNISVTTNHGPDGKLNADVKLTFTAALTGDYKISVVLIEDSIIDVQESGASYDSLYVHMHVLRDMFTAHLGDVINTATTTLVPGRVIIKRYNLGLNPIWNKKHLGIVAFVHRGSDEVVVQSGEFEVHE